MTSSLLKFQERDQRTVHFLKVLLIFFGDFGGFNICAVFGVGSIVHLLITDFCHLLHPIVPMRCAVKVTTSLKANLF